MRSTWMGIIILATVAAASIWWLSTLTDDTGAPVSESGPDWYFDEAVFRHFGADGVILYRFDAARIVHQPADGSARLHTVRLEWLQGDPMSMSAADAVVSADGTVVELGGGVRIVDEQVSGPLTITMERLRLDTGSQTASTIDPVRITASGSTLDAVGMHADARTGLIRLDASVRGHYVH